MITAIDANILIDVVGADPVFGSDSRAAIEMCARGGSLIVSPVVAAEFASGCASATKALAILKALTIEFVDFGEMCAAQAGEVRGRGRSGDRIIADYLIGVHAATHADRLLTRDAGFLQLKVPGLVVLTPAKALA